MATKKEKQELIDILKFTPMKVQMTMQGYGGESYAGRVDRKIYEYFKSRKLDIGEYASSWDSEEMKVPDDLQPFPPGSPFECDSMFHASGAELSDLNQITIYDDKGNVLWEHNMGWSNLEDSGVVVEQFSSVEFDDLEPGEVVFWGGQGEKGCFFDGEFTLTQPFDPKKLTIKFESCDGWHIVNYIEYNGEDIDGSGGYSTTGKWAENKWILGGDEEVYEAEEFVADEDEEEDNEQESKPDFVCTECDWKGLVDELARTDDDSDGVCPECSATVSFYSEDDWDPATELDKIKPPEGFDWSPLPEEPAVTDWFDKDVKPAYKGTYEAVIDAPWPLSGIKMIEWTGRSWKDDGKKIAITKWRGLAENPEA